MILMPDPFSFAYVPNWYSQLDMLAEMALPEWHQKPLFIPAASAEKRWCGKKGSPPEPESFVQRRAAALGGRYTRS